MSEREIAIEATAVRHDSDVMHFVAEDNGYYAILRNGERLDMVKVHTFQPRIHDYDDYFAFMFVQAETRFFILRQRVVENRAQNWECALEILPGERHDFFRRACWEEGFLEKLAVSTLENPEES